MLAYVFWHRPGPGIDSRSYEAALLAFHGALAADHPPGFRRSATFRVDRVRWLPGKGQGFEDWYLVADSAALDSLNVAAVGPGCREAHDGVAGDAAAGVAGLYRLRGGVDDLESAPRAVWFQKPAGTSYDALYSTLAPALAGTDAGLWGRMMTLGPTPEFCLTLPEGAPRPAVKVAFDVRRALVRR